ncbi:Uncharacterized conserved protein [Rodentibacter pneumotropicus]|uniref:Uncharacterized conserved protein n=1 Tax=Rodentibacter pneumotropicus TaxID=758 RepID=A0A3S4VCX3_9PAST|nr:Uncharacterized conserved protein [Rodentibacter pneumotropicus]
MATEQDYEKLKELMEFPAAMTFKVAGINREDLAQDLIAVVQKYIPGIIFPEKNVAVKVPIIPFLLMSLHKTLSKWKPSIKNSLKSKA